MRVLIIDDEGNLRRMLRAVLESEGWAVEEAADGRSGLAMAREVRPEVVLLDLVLPGESGLEILPELLDETPGLPVVMMSGEATLEDAVEATRRGAFHFLEKPLTPESVLITLRNALDVGRARDLSRALQDEMGPGARLVGESEAMDEVRATIRKVAPTDARVLITGESGTGKELAAAAIHALSGRRGGPFVRVNSAAIPRDLVESEMFGHERGAFTGATERRRGRFELAHRGTLFLDEVGDLGAGAQAKLLRALESGTIQRVGGQTTLEVDVRLVAATNRDLALEVAADRFREDLLFRLEVVPIRMPSLRERPQDVAPLVDHGLERLRKQQGLVVPRVSEEGRAALGAHTWPGNVRELFNLLERAAILHPGAELGAAEIRTLLLTGGRRPRASGPEYRSGDARPLAHRLESYERSQIEGALREADGTVAEAARILQTDRANLYRRMKRLGIRTSNGEN
ncbi:MAG: sigma-54-dependent Fis family transcriptional regulator [Gemmatimonadales bacterium]|nr:MAG: sigma-54-dependent Fis family transcriptional regulator [Gemmatimonadales bacterium]